jgi:hypothetical protein
MPQLLTPRGEGVNFFSHLKRKRAGAGVKMQEEEMKERTAAPYYQGERRHSL